jgi:two-component system sensor histidine kinase/response regulator
VAHVDLPSVLLATGCAGLAGATVVWVCIRRRDQPQALSILAASAHSLATTQDVHLVLPGLLAGVGAALHCRHLELHELHEPVGDGLPVSSLRHGWSAPGQSARSADPALRQRPWHPARSRWLAELAANRPVVATAAALPVAERAELAGSGAVALHPLIVAGRLWGCLLCLDQGCKTRSADELAVLRLLAEMSASAIERTRTAADLSEARTAAVSGDRAKREFLANISHEVRTPLNGVLGMAGLLLDTELDVRQREYAQVVRNSAENLHALLNDLIDLAKAEGEQQVERVRYDPLRLAEDVVAMLSERAHAKGVDMAVHPQDSLPRRALGDPTRMRQVLMNMVGNAIKFTARGHVIVHVSWSEDAGGVVIYAVEDTGIGIDSEARARLFSPFSQGDGSSTRRFGGTGLGLAICRRMVQVMAGTITCRSELGKGTTFEVRLPSPEVSSGVSVRSTQVPTATLGARILVVEAEGATREAIAAVCRRIGLVAEGAAGCSEAIERLAAVGAESPRLVLVSANLPGASDLPRCCPAGVACILLAPVAMRPTQADAERLGFAACLVKPPRIARLSEAVGRAVERSVQDDSSEAEETGVHRRSRLRALVVEDDAVNQLLAKAVLEREGVRVDVAADGHEALEALARASYHVVLMDLLMPVMDGLACAREIRRLERERNQPAIPIIAVSAVDQPDVQERCRQAGMDGHVRKPFEPKHLRRILRRLIAERQRRA